MISRKSKKVEPKVGQSKVFAYTSMCCDAPASKPACVATGDEKNPATLGTWHCGLCGKKASVRRTVKTQAEVVVEVANAA